MYHDNSLGPSFKSAEVRWSTSEPERPLLVPISKSNSALEVATRRLWISIGASSGLGFMWNCGAAGESVEGVDSAGEFVENDDDESSDGRELEELKEEKGPCKRGDERGDAVESESWLCIRDRRFCESRESRGDDAKWLEEDGES